MIKTTIFILFLFMSAIPIFCQITVLFPNEGERFLLGKTITIKWNTGVIPGNVDIKLIYYKRDRVAGVLASDTPNNGAFEWKIEKFSDGKPIRHGCHYKILVTSKIDSDAWDESDNEFNISLPPHKLPGNCFDLNCCEIWWNYANKNGPRPYLINYESFNRLSHHGITPEQVKQAVILAADTWNEQANAGYFRLVGNVKFEDSDYKDCDGDCCKAKGISSLIYVADDRGSDIGYSRAGPRCWTKYPDGSFRPTQFVVILTNQLGCFIAQKDMTPDKYDLVKGIMHELGHTLGLDGHEKKPIYKWATMSGGNPGINHSRDLWQRDIECTNCISRSRSINIYSSTQDRNGQFSEPKVIGYHASKASVGARYNSSGGFMKFSSTIRMGIWQEAYAWVWKRDLKSIKSQSIRFIGKDGMAINPLESIGPREVVFREEPEIQRIFYPHYKDSPKSYALGSSHQVYTTWFRSNDNDRHISARTGGMYYCKAMTGEMYCSPSKRIPLYSGKPIAVAWDNRNNKSIFAWVNQNRKSDEHSREVLVSVGYINHTLLPQPESLGVKSNVGPGLACNKGSAGGYDCILAYVDADRADGAVRIKKFRARKTKNRYSLEIDPNTYKTEMKTGSSIAAWYNKGTRKFYMAIRQADYGQYLLIYSSKYGVNWKMECCLGYSISGPSAVSYEQGERNCLVWLGE